MGRPRKQTITTRDPQPVNRDPVIVPAGRPDEPREYKPRRLIRASMPCVCPECGHNTRMSDGRHVDPVRGTILEYRTCIKCKAELAAIREMTLSEKQKLCTRAEAVREYEHFVLCK